MDEYIKREDAIKAITYVGTADPTDIIPLTLYAAQKKIRKIPTADVAPKSEVAREIFEEIEKAHDACIEIGSRNVGWLKVNKFEQMFAELKKKYTEEKE